MTAVRIIGTDTGTAGRVAWLSRMTAARDVALGIGALSASISGIGPSAWVLAGACADGADALALAQALRARRVGGVGAVAMIAGAAVSAVVGAGAAIGLAGRQGPLAAFDQQRP